MTELFLEYKDERGDLRRVAVTTDKCVVGRHSEANICIPDSRLSRQHLSIERFGTVFVASDAGSSYGTVLNGQPLTEPKGLTNGDVLELGGLRIDVELVSDEPAYVAETTEASAASPGGNSNMMLVWIAIPVFGLVFLMFSGAIIFLLVSKPTTTVAKKQNDTADNEDDFEDDSDDKKTSSKTSTTNSGSTTTPGTSSSNSTTDSNVSTTSNTVPSGNLTESAKIETNASAFLRRIGQNDPRAFLTSEQANKVTSKIKQFSGSSAVAENLKSASKNSSKIASIAQDKSLRPQFLAIAAVAKLGSSRGDVVQTAESMKEVLGKLATSIGTERADDAMLVVAAYGQGTAGEFLKFRNMLQDLANKTPESARVIRTIWFLQKNGKITQAEYENALTFLAIGTISQNPKDFGVNADPLTL